MRSKQRARKVQSEASTSNGAPTTAMSSTLFIVRSKKLRNRDPLGSIGILVLFKNCSCFSAKTQPVVYQNYDNAQFEDADESRANLKKITLLGFIYHLCHFNVILTFWMHLVLRLCDACGLKAKTNNPYSFHMS